MIHRAVTATTRVMVSAAIPPTVNARNGSSIISANADKQKSFPGNQALRPDESRIGRALIKHPEDHEQVDYS